jgi:hypothetical protein
MASPFLIVSLSNWATNSEHRLTVPCSKVGDSEVDWEYSWPSVNTTMLMYLFSLSARMMMQSRTPWDVPVSIHDITSIIIINI